MIFFLFSWHFLTKSFEFSDKIISILGIYLGFIWIYFLSVTNFDCCTYSVRSLFALGKILHPSLGFEPVWLKYKLPKKR